MTSVSLSSADPITAKADALVIGLHSSPDGPSSPFEAAGRGRGARGGQGQAG